MDKNRESTNEGKISEKDGLENELKDAYKLIVRNSLKKEYEENKDNAESYFDPDRELNELETLDEFRDYALNYCFDELKKIPGTEDITITKENIKEAKALFDAAVHAWYINEYKWLDKTDGKIAEERVEDEQYVPQTYIEEEMPEIDGVSQSVPEEDNKKNQKEEKRERLYNARRHYIIEHMDDYLSVRPDTSWIDHDASNSLSLLGGKMSEVYDETALEWYGNEVFESRCAYLLDGDVDMSEEKLAKYIEENEKAIPDERAWELYHDKYLIPMREQQKEAEEAQIRADAEAEKKRRAEEKAARELNEKIEKEKEKAKKEEAERKAKALKEEKLKKEEQKKAEGINKVQKEIKEEKTVTHKTAEEIAAEKAEAEKLERFLDENEVQYKKIVSDPKKLQRMEFEYAAKTEYNAAIRELAGSLNDTGSIFSWDSKEFTNMKKYLSAVSKIDLSVKQLGQAFNAIREGVKAYEEHAKADPRPDNKRRNDRLNVMGSLVKLADCFDNKVKCPKEMFKLSADNMVIDILCKNIKNGYTKKQIEEKVARSESYSKYMGGLSLCEMHKISKDPKEAKNAIVSIHNIAVKAKENKANAAEESKNPDENVFNL